MVDQPVIGSLGRLAHLCHKCGANSEKPLKDNLPKMAKCSLCSTGASSSQPLLDRPEERYPGFARKGLELAVAARKGE